jgi:uncharacterized protein
MNELEGIEPKIAVFREEVRKIDEEYLLSNVPLRRLATLVVSALAACSLLDVQAADRVRAGEWSMTVTVPSGKQVTRSACLSQNEANAINGDANSIKAHLQKKIAGNDCVPTDVTTAGNEVTITWVCTSGRQNVATTTYRGETFVTVNTNGANSESKWVGPCNLSATGEEQAEYGTDLDKDLFRAIESKEAAKVKELLDRGADANAHTSNGYTALMGAAFRGDASSVEALLAKGATVDAKESEIGQTALIAAANAGHTNVVKILLDKGAAIEVRDKRANCTPLILAAMAGHAPVVQLLLDKGAKVNAKGIGGGTGLFGAAARGHAEVVQILLENGADINARFENGMTALTIATAKGHAKVVDLLKKAGAQ